MQKDVTIVVDLENPREFLETDFTKFGKEMEGKCKRMYNCPYRKTFFMSICPFCQEFHIKPKSYTGITFGIKEEKPMGITLKRRDISQNLDKLGIKNGK